MAMTIIFDEAVDCYFVRWTGTITSAEYQSSYRIILGRPWFGKDLNVIHDWRNTVMEFTRTDVLAKANTFDTVASAFGEMISAVLVSGAEDKQLMSAFVGASVKARDSVEYFDSYDDARAWVGLPEDYPDPFKVAW